MGDLTFVVFTALSALLNIGPVYWQIVQGNSGPISLGFWVVTLNLVYLVNAAVWYDDVVNRAPIWCDISNKVRMAGEIGRIASVMCVARFLAAVVSPKATAITRQDRRSRAIFDYSLCFGFPIVVAACEIIYQPVRFALIRTRGCDAVHTLGWPTLLLWLIWAPILASIGVLYSMYTVYRLVKHRRNFGRIVAGSHSALNTSRFIRLAVLSLSYLLIALPFNIYSMLTNIASSGVYSDYSWDYVHSVWDVSPILYYPYADPENNLGLLAWSNVIVGIIYFAAFGFGAEAMALYSRASQKLGLDRLSALLSPKAIRSRLWPTAQSEGKRVPPHAPSYGGSFHVTYGQPVQVTEQRGIKVVVNREEDSV